MSKTVLLQTIQFRINKMLFYSQLNVKTVLFKTSEFSINTLFNVKNSLISNYSL